MYVCVCNAISKEKLQEARKNSLSIEEFWKENDSKPCCKRCIEEIEKELSTRYLNVV